MQLGLCYGKPDRWLGVGRGQGHIARHLISALLERGFWALVERAGERNVDSYFYGWHFHHGLDGNLILQGFFQVLQTFDLRWVKLLF